MSLGDNSPGISRLTGLMKEIAEQQKDTALILDFGVIAADMSLITNNFPEPIPAKDYLVCRCAALKPVEDVHTYGHLHEVEPVGFSLELDPAGGPLDPPHTHEKAKGSVYGHKTKTAIDTVNIARRSERCIAPGDRVLVAWVQNDAVVIDIILQGNEIPWQGD